MDWITRVYTYCHSNCIRIDPEEQEHTLREVEKQCGRNCLRKYDKAYKLYENVEDKIFKMTVEDWNIDIDAI